VYAIKGKGAHIKKGVNRKKNRKRTGKKSVRSLVVLVEHSTTRNVNRNRERERHGTCGLKVVVLDEMSTILVGAATAEKNEATGK
jgi:hypothetical protein